MGNQKPEADKPRPRCNICGRFVPKEGPWPCVYRDDRVAGGWEHR